MNKTELIEKIAAGSGLTKVDAKKALDAAVAAIQEALVAGDKVQLVGFGTFTVQNLLTQLMNNCKILSTIKKAAQTSRLFY